MSMASRLAALSLILSALAAAYGTASRVPAPLPLLRGLSSTPTYEPLERLIERDPFAGAPIQPHASPSPQVAFEDGGAGLDFVAFDVPRDSPLAEPDFILKGTIIGEEPVAYLASGSTMRIVRIGDLVGDRKVTAIDARGVRFSDGVRLDLESSTVPKVSPSARLRTTGVRRIPAARRVLTPTSTASLPPAAAPTPLESVTPAPLPTIRFGAYPLGTRPTSDPGAPTAFPYPYPYPPK